MIVAYVETSGESAELARAEVEAAAAALGGRLRADAAAPAALLEVEAPDEEVLVRLAGRLALARRTFVPIGRSGSLEAAAAREGTRGVPASFRRLGESGAAADATVRALGRAYVGGGGSIDLERPKVRFWLAGAAGSGEILLREVAEVDRAGLAARAMPRLPFRRPVSLPPRLSRAAVNLAGVRPGSRVLDPFLGTGALLAEAALLGARVYGVDVDAAMVRGALRNFAHLGVHAEAVVQGDVRTAEIPLRPEHFDAIVTDPPYGRSSASVGSAPERLVPEALARWAKAVAPGGRVVVIVPGGPPILPDPWVETVRVPVRVHRSLTREFRVYRRRP